MSPQRFLLVVWLLLAAIAQSNPGKFACGQETADQDPQNQEVGLPEHLWQQGWIALWDGSTTFGWRNTKHTSIQQSRWVLPKEPSVVRTGSEFSSYWLLVEYSLTDGAADLILQTNPVARQESIDHGKITLPPTPSDQTYLLLVKVAVDGTVAPSIGTFKGWDTTTERLPVENLRPLPKIQAPYRGYVGFRVNTGQLEVSSILLRPVFTDPPLDGNQFSAQQLDDLQWLPKGANEQSAEHASFSMRGGPGYLVLKQQQPENFILQTQVRCSQFTNSGIFFRCIPNEALNGYEAQINNQFSQDPSMPMDCGTGGIFRRVDARRIVATDHGQWFSETLVASGANISVWVNGYQVTDWSDQRQPHNNPRKGSKRNAGQLQIQSHDEQTEIDFRNMLLREYPKQRQPEGR